MELSICQLLFYILAALAILCAFAVVSFRNPVSSAMGMALCFALTAAILFGMGAQFLGIVQLIVYAGAILVLFLFVVMMLDIKDEERKTNGRCNAIAGAIVAGMLAGIIASIAIGLPGATDNPCPAKVLCNSFGDLAIGQPATPATDSATPASTCSTCPAAVTPGAPLPGPETYGGPLPKIDPVASDNDTKLIGATLFSQYNIQFVILAFALLSGTVGAVALARKIRKD